MKEKIIEVKINPENLTQEEIENKIAYLEKQIRNANWGINVENRKKRVEVLKSYLTIKK